MDTVQRQDGAIRRAVRGAIEGAICACLGTFLGSCLMIHEAFPATLRRAALMGVAGAVLFALGRAISGRVLGAFAGGVAGLFLGGYLGAQVGAYYVYYTPAAVQPGQPLEIAGPTLEGADFDLKQLRGKVVLVDFWATWCGPCVAELPNVRQVYDRHHQDGFEVVGVSLDNSRERLAAFVRERQLPWPQIFFDEDGSRGWANPLARQYDITAIPSMFLIDQQGQVAASDVRGESLERAVAGLLGKEPGGTVADAFLMPMRTVAIPLGPLVGFFLGAVGGALVERGLRKSAGGESERGSTSQHGRKDHG